ncbi:MAG: rRNA maturation RNase YbeY [Candidatus Wildermuthbacteria bacterium]|nr:rRNA maturation RNase YbeY [Candidatus Wildermuthbacteria bacterium]
MIEIKNLSGKLQYVDSLKKIGRVILRKERKQNLDLSLVFLKPPKMQELNRVYRGKDKPTNVLSFQEEELGLGELVLCPAVIRKDAKKYGITFKAEFIRIFIHGLLHLAGYDHEKDADFKEMSRKENYYFSLVS